MCEYFWLYETDLPPGIGVQTFGIVHLAWVTISVLLILMTILISRRQTEVIRRRIQVTTVYLMVTAHLFCWLWTAIIGHYAITELLPLHLCTLSVFVESAAVLSGRTLLKEFSYCCGLPGAVFALITPVMGGYPLFNYYYLQFAMAHTILILLPLIWIFADGFRPDIRRIPPCFGLLLFFAGIAAFVNRLIGSNYMFLSFAPTDTPLEIFEAWFGNPGYLIPLTLLVLIVWLILYTPVVLSTRLQRRKRFEIGL